MSLNESFFVMAVSAGYAGTSTGTSKFSVRTQSVPQLNFGSDIQNVDSTQSYLTYAKFSSFLGAKSRQTYTCILSSSFTPLNT